jgi:purine-binding chemotaxis protein CheW
MESMRQFVIFLLNGLRIGLSLRQVISVIRAVAPTPLLQGPAIAMGVFDWRGTIVPILNIRSRFGCPERDISPEDHFLIARDGRRIVALPVDQVRGVAECAEASILKAREILPRLKLIDGVLQLEDGLLLIHNLEEFLFPDEERELAASLEVR